MPATDKFKSRYGPWALVTGAARGLGAEFARQVAARGLNLVLLDTLADELSQVADEVRKSGVQTKTIVTDLSKPGFIQTVRDQAEGLDIGLLVNNAGFGPVGLFVERSLEEKLTSVAVNVQATLMLVHEFAVKMASRGRGGIILLSSASALQGSAYVANYAATKAYNLILAESLWEELRGRGVDVLGFMPGITRTPGFELSKAHMERTDLVKAMEAAPTVTEALDALGRRPSHVAGRRNRLTMVASCKLTPRKIAIKLAGKTMRDLYEEE